MEERKIFCMEERENLNKKKSNSTYAGTVLLVEHYRSKCQTRLMNIR